MNLGENIKKARKTAGMTQKELAEKLDVYPKDISRWENGERTPSAIALGNVCKALNASADEILELNKWIIKGLQSIEIIYFASLFIIKKYLVIYITYLVICDILNTVKR